MAVTGGVNVPLSFCTQVNHLEKCTSKTPAVTNVVTSAMFSKRFFTAHQWAFALCAWKQLPGWSWDMFAVFPVQEQNQDISREKSLWSRQTLMMGAYHKLCPLTPPSNSSSYFSCLSFMCLPACLSYAVTLPITVALLSACHTGSLHGFPCLACMFAATCPFVYSLTFTSTHLVCRGQTETHTLTSETCRKEMKRLKETVWRMKWTHSLPLHAVFTLNRLSYFDMNSFTTKVCSTAVNMTCDLSCP